MRDIVAGQTDAKVLATHRHGRCHTSQAEIEASLTSHYRGEHIFVLGQHLALYDAFQSQLQDCHREVRSFLEELANHAQAPQHELSAPRTRFRRQANVPRFDIRPLLHHLTGTCLTQIDSIGPYTAMCLVSEIGTDMSRRATEKHFTSWLTLCPDNKITGERILRSRTRPSASRAASPCYE